MTDIQDYVIPSFILLKRLEGHQEAVLEAHDKTPKWRWIKRQRLIGASSAYGYEIEQLLNLSSRSQPFWEDIGKKKS